MRKSGEDHTMDVRSGPPGDAGYTLIELLVALTMMVGLTALTCRMLFDARVAIVPTTPVRSPAGPPSLLRCQRFSHSTCRRIRAASTSSSCPDAKHPAAF